MTAETQVVKEVSEVSEVETEEKCGLDMSSYQDLAKPNGINQVGGNVDENSDTTEGSSDNSYVFVNGSSDDPVDEVIAVEKSDVSPQFIAAAEEHVNAGETNVCVVQESDAAVPVKNGVDSLQKDVGDEVQVATPEQNDGIVENADAEPVEEVKDQIEPTGNQESPQAAITESEEQLEGILAAPNADTKLELSEACVQPTENMESNVGVFEANKESVGAEETKTLLPVISDDGKEIKEASLQTSDGLTLQGQDSKIVVLEVSTEPGATKSASPETGADNEETEESNLVTSDDLSKGQNSEVVDVEAKVDPREETEVMSPLVKESGDDNKEINNDVQECKDVANAPESGDRGEFNILLPDLEADDKDKEETEGTNVETRYELTEAAGNQSAEIESMKTNLEEHEDFESGHESSKVVALEASVSAETTTENDNSEEGNSLHSTDDHTDNHKSESVILEAVENQPGTSDESIEGRDSQEVALNAPESALKEVNLGVSNSDQQHEVEPIEESGISQVRGALGSFQTHDGREKEIDEGRDSQDVGLNAPESALKEVSFGILKSEQQREVEPLEERGITQVRGELGSCRTNDGGKTEIDEGRDALDVALDASDSALKEVNFGTLISEQQHEVEPLKQVAESVILKVPEELESRLTDDGREKEIDDEEEKTDLCSHGQEINVSDTAYNQDIQVNSEAKSSVNETDVPLEASNSVLDENKDDSRINECAQKIESNGFLDGGENSLEVNGSEIIGKPVERDENAPLDSIAVRTVQHEEEKIDDEKEKTDLCSHGKEINVSDTAHNQDIQVNSEAKSSVNETDVPLEASNSALDENKDDCRINVCAQKIEPYGSLDGGENSLEVNGSEISGKPVERDENLPSDSIAVTMVQHATLSDANKCIEDVVPCPVNKTKLDSVESETVVENKISSPPVVNDEGLGSEAALENIDSGEKVHSFQGDDLHSKAQDVSGDIESSQSCSVSIDVKKMDSQVEDSCTLGGEDMLRGDLVATGTVVLDCSAVDKEESTSKVVSEIIDVGNVDEFNDVDSNREHNLMCQESSSTEKSQITKVAAASMPEQHSTAEQELELGIGARPFNFLIRIPRFDDEKLRERIRHAQLQVEEKTQCRDAFRLEIQKKKANLQSYGVEFEAAIGEERDARRLVKKKRIEIDSLQSLINRVKNAISVEEIDARVSNMEHMMQHETLALKEEKQFIREMKQLKQLREQLSSNIGSKDEVQQALDQKDQIDNRLKVLKKELEGLKNMVLKAQAVATTARKKYDNENKRFKELQDQFKAADDIRQAAYAQLLSLRKELFDKNKQFRMYKDDAAAASDCALNRQKEALHRLCVNQVEAVMELWNKNDEFRKEYVRCNLRSTVRRLGTLDGRSLGPDEELPVVPSYMGERVMFNRHKTSAGSQTAVEQKREVAPVGVVVADVKSPTKVEQSAKQTVKMREPATSTLAIGLLSSTAADTITASLKTKEEHLQKEAHLQTKEEHSQRQEELELARKAEELRKEEEAAKLKELRRLEEAAKAREAQERKIRNDKKAQMKAELRAQKEAEQREKEREKRLRKKERKKAVAAEANEDNNDGENAQSSDSAVETIKYPVIKEIPPTVTKRPQKPSQFLKQSKSKSIPPPLRNRNRRKMQQWMWVIITSLLVIALFFLGNIGVFSNLRPRKSGF